MEEVIELGQKEILNKEEVPGGFRPLEIQYTYQDKVVLEKITYQNKVTDPGWAAIKYIDRELKTTTDVTTKVTLNVEGETANLLDIRLVEDKVHAWVIYKEQKQEVILESAEVFQLVVNKISTTTKESTTTTTVKK